MVHTIIITFIYLSALFIGQNLKKNSNSRSRIMRMCHFWAQNGPFAPNKIFFWKILNITLIYLLASFIAQNFKKNSSSGSRIMRMHNFWNQNDPFPQMRIFLGKPVHEPCFFHSCLSSTCQKLKSNINLLVKYWWLKNTEISLAESNFWL